MTFEIACDKNATSPTNYKVNVSNACNVVVSFNHTTGCPSVDMTKYYSFLTDNPWVIAILFIVFGPILNFFGNKFIPWVIAIVSGVAAFILLIVIF